MSLDQQPTKMNGAEGAAVSAGPGPAPPPGDHDPAGPYVSTTGPQVPRIAPASADPRALFMAGSQPIANREPEVRFLGSARTFEQAEARKTELDEIPVAGTKIVIYKSWHEPARFHLLQVYPPPTGSNRPGYIGEARATFDLFRISQELLGRGHENRLARMIETIMRDFGQQGDPSSAGPR